jgi:hypothetical protein
MVFKKYAWIFLMSMVLSALVWLPSGGSQIGKLPFRLRLLGLVSVIPGPLSLVYWDLRYNQPADALPWLVVLLVDTFALSYGLYSSNSRPARLVGYVAVFVWVLMGLVFSTSGL